jgi:hypothetical protein
MNTSDAITEFETEAKRQGVSPVALLDAQAKAEGISWGRLYERLLQSSPKSSVTVRLLESKRQVQPELESAFTRLGHNSRAARAAAGGRSRLREASAATKHEVPGGEENVIDDTSFEGGDFGKADYAYTPSDDSAKWQLLLTMTPGGKPDPDFVRAAVLAIDPASQSVETVAIPEDDLAGVLATLSKAWKAAIPDDQLPAILTAEAAAFKRLGVPLKGLSAAARGRAR